MDIQSGISIRDYRADDFENAAALFVELDELHLKNRSEIKPEVVDPEYRAVFMKQELIKPESIMLVAEISNQIVGFAAGSIKHLVNHMVVKDCTYGVINDLVVKKEFQNSGIGKMMIDEMENRLKEKGASYIELKVYAFNNDAINFYEKLGFKKKLVVYEK